MRWSDIRPGMCFIAQGYGMYVVISTRDGVADIWANVLISKLGGEASFETWVGESDDLFYPDAMVSGQEDAASAHARVPVRPSEDQEV